MNAWCSGTRRKRRRRRRRRRRRKRKRGRKLDELWRYCGGRSIMIDGCMWATLIKAKPAELLTPTGPAGRRRFTAGAERVAVGIVGAWVGDKGVGRKGGWWHTCNGCEYINRAIMLAGLGSTKHCYCHIAAPSLIVSLPVLMFLVSMIVTHSL